MGAVVVISPEVERQLARARTTRVETLPQWQRDLIAERLGIIYPLVRGEKTLEQVAAASGRSVSTIRRWHDKFDAGDYAGLATKKLGKTRKAQRWDAAALEYFQLPSRMNSGEVAANLRADGYVTMTNHGPVPVSADQVRRFRKTLPSNFDETSQRKLGEHHYRLNETPYVIRDWGHVPVGYLYEMDGHTCDFYCQHPTKAGYFRPELTILLDVRSQYIVDFWLGGFENSMDLRWLLSRAFLQHDHLCYELHIDPGAGRAKTMTDRVSGYAAKLGFEIHFAQPGNARGKGLNEGEYKIFEGRFGKTMPTYLHNRTDDAMRLFKWKWDHDKVEKMTVKQCYDLIDQRYIQRRNNEPRKGLGGKTPAELWATLKKNPVIAEAAVLVRPRVKRTVQNGRVYLHNRCYQVPQPWRAQYENRQMVVEYDEWRDGQVWVYDREGRFVCEAPLHHKRPGIPESRVQERLEATEAGQRKRLELKLAENAARAKLPLNGAQLIEAFEADADPALPEADPAATVLASGMSFTVAPEPAARKPRAPSARAHALTEQLDAAPPVEESSAERFARARRLESCTALTAADAEWLRNYRRSGEYLAHRHLADEAAAEDIPLVPPSLAKGERNDFYPSSQPSPASGEGAGYEDF